MEDGVAGGLGLARAGGEIRRVLAREWELVTVVTCVQQHPAWAW